MSYNQKVWLAVLIVCTVFWLLVISSLYSLSKKFGPEHHHNQAESIAETSYPRVSSPLNQVQAQATPLPLTE